MFEFVPAEKNELDQVFSWFEGTDEYIFNLWGGGYLSYPVSEVTKKDYYDRREKTNAVSYVMKEDGCVVGHCTIREADKGYYRLGFVTVDPEKRGQGNGKRLVSMALREIKEKKDAKGATLGVFSCNQVAASVYQAAGFRATGITEGRLVGGILLKLVEMQYDFISLK